MHFHIWAVFIGLVHMIGRGLAAAEYSAFLIIVESAAEIVESAAEVVGTKAILQNA